MGRLGPSRWLGAPRLVSQVSGPPETEGPRDPPAGCPPTVPRRDALVIGLGYSGRISTL